MTNWDPCCLPFEPIARYCLKQFRRAIQNWIRPLQGMLRPLKRCSSRIAGSSKASIRYIYMNWDWSEAFKPFSRMPDLRRQTSAFNSHIDPSVEQRLYGSAFARRFTVSAGGYHQVAATRVKRRP